MEIKEIKKRPEDGNTCFVIDNLEGKRQDSFRRKELTDGQQPYTIVLSCADSRLVLAYYSLETSKIIFL